jgi:hypothetical protein
LFSFLCPATPPTDRPTPLGTAHGTLDPSGAYRFSVKYASAPRWGPSTVVTSWNLPYVHFSQPSSQAKSFHHRNGSANVSALPLACPQPGVDPSAYSEDCLSMVLYIPPALTSSLSSAAPTLVWYVYFFRLFYPLILTTCPRVHGGSFIVGSATGPGLDGSNLAVATNSIVAVVQYRLGAVCPSASSVAFQSLKIVPARVYGPQWTN